MSALLARFRATLAGRVVFGYFESQTPNYAAGLAFNAFLTMFPLILGILSLVGLFVNGPDAQRLLVHAFPAPAQAEVQRTVTGLRQHAGTLGLLSLAGLAWSGTNLFCSLEFSLDRIFGLRGRDPLRQRLQGLRMIVVFTFATVVTVLTATFIGPVPPWVGFLAGWVVMSWLLFWIYEYVPSRRFPVRQVLPGAVLAALGIEVLTLVFPLYTLVTRQVTTYTRGFALVFVLLAWVYFLSQLILIGAVFNRSRLPLAGVVPQLQDTAVVALPEDAQGRGVERQRLGGADL